MNIKSYKKYLDIKCIQIHRMYVKVFRFIENQYKMYLNGSKIDCI